MELTKQKCKPCEAGVPPMDEKEVKENLKKIKNWKVVNNKLIVKEYKFKDFKTALYFVNKVGKIAESEGHHPDVFLSYGKVEIRLWTHAIDGLSINDFILAAKIDK